MTTDYGIFKKIAPGDPSVMAEGIALQRMAESRLPEDIRIFFDPYAVRFINPAKLVWAKKHPAEVQAMVEALDQQTPGWNNSIRARVRYFDDVAGNAPGEGFTQLVIFGAGYDTRAYRISTLREHMRVFEVDRPETQVKKIAIVEEIFGQLPGHVSFIPYVIDEGNTWADLQSAGFSPEKKTLFMLEGLVMYLSRPAVEGLFLDIARHAGAGSAVLFDFLPQSIADGSSDAEGGRMIRDFTISIGEPIRSGFTEGEVVPFLMDCGYSGVQVVLPSAYAAMYYTGKNAGRKVSGLLSFAYAIVAGGGRI
nr:class I SAM-dependent methyltransferase [uncultured Methanoregula sp.]